MADAEDVTQETFASAIETLARSGEGAGPTIGWLYTVASRRLVDEARRRRLETVPLEVRGSPRADVSCVPALADFLRHVATFLEAGPGPFITLAMLFVVLPPLVLAHELGHAGAALALRPGQVTVSVGSRKRLVACTIGRLTVGMHVLMLPWRAGGLCGYTPQESRA